MFAPLNILAALPWRLIAAGALTAVLFVGGCQYGEGRVTAEWEAEKAAQAQAAAKQGAQVAAATARQSDINQEVSNEFQKSAAAIAADRPHLLAHVPRRVRDDTPGGASAVPEVSAASARVDVPRADAVPATGQPGDSSACEKLAEDAARTTLMVVAFQRWYVEQARNLMVPMK